MHVLYYNICNNNNKFESESAHISNTIIAISILLILGICSPDFCALKIQILS